MHFHKVGGPHSEQLELLAKFKPQEGKASAVSADLVGRWSPKGKKGNEKGAPAVAYSQRDAPPVPGLCWRTASESGLAKTCFLQEACLDGLVPYKLSLL